VSLLLFESQQAKNNWHLIFQLGERDSEIYSENTEIAKMDFLENAREKNG